MTFYGYYEGQYFCVYTYVSLFEYLRFIVLFKDFIHWTYLLKLDLPIFKGFFMNLFTIRTTQFQGMGFLDIKLSNQKFLQINYYNLNLNISDFYETKIFATKFV